MAIAFVLTTLLLSGTPPGQLVWSTPDQLTKGSSRTFIAKGTRKGNQYVFRARGECRWLPRQLVTEFGFVFTRERPERIFGIDFRVKFGQQAHRFLEVGERVPAQSELVFVADQDDVSVHVADVFELPEGVVCTVDELEIVAHG